MHETTFFARMACHTVFFRMVLHVRIAQVRELSSLTMTKIGKDTYVSHMQQS